MKIRTTIIEKVPDWAVVYLENDDDSGLSAEDKKMVDDWVDSLFDRGLRLICPLEGSESEFEPYPAFGLGSGTVDYTAEVLPKEYDVVFADIMVMKVRAHSKAGAKREAERIINSGNIVYESIGRKVKSVKLAEKGEE